MLAGCSGKLSHIDINTTLTVDTTFNGSREMTADIPADAYKYAFGGSLTALEDMINQYTPVQLNEKLKDTLDRFAQSTQHKVTMRDPKSLVLNISIF